jgi:multidrug efflux pump
MNISGLCISRPIATTLLMLGITIAGAIGSALLPVAPLPQVDFPTIAVQASLPGASPQTMAATVATPLERTLGHIAGVSEMTSSSSLGSTRVILQFDLDRDIDGAARDVQAALNASRTLLPTMPSNPTYRKVNPADAPIMILALTSDTLTRGAMYDAADSILAQKLAQVEGVGQVTLGGGARPAVRVEMNPDALNKYGIGAEQVRSTIVDANAHRPKGSVERGDRRWEIGANDQAVQAAEYDPLIVTWHDSAAVRIKDIATTIDSVQDLRNAGSANGEPAVLLVLNRQPGANIIATVDRIRELLPQLRASIPGAIDLDVMVDRTPTIRAALHEVERTLVISVLLVMGVVLVFLRTWRAALIPSIAVPVSLIAAFGVMYLCGFSLDTFSLMALTVATGFVVDDAIVVSENVARHIEDGMSPREAAERGSREVGFTVVAMSVSLVAVFIPILLMGGIVGRLFREFAVTLSAAIMVSLVVSRTATPMLCARFLRATGSGRSTLAGGTAPAADTARPGSSGQSPAPRAFLPHYFDRLRDTYARSLDWVLDHGALTMLVLVAVIALNVFLYVVIPKGFFPQQDTGRITGSMQADQATSFQSMRTKQQAFVDIVRADPAVENVVAFTGGGQRNAGQMFIALKPLGERKLSADRIMARLRGKLARVPGARLILQPVQDIRVGGRSAGAQYQFTLQAEHLDDLTLWGPKILEALQQLPQLVDVNTDQQDHGLQTSLVIDRDTAARLDVTPVAIDTTLNDLFGQRQVGAIYTALNQYRVVMEAAPTYWQSPEALRTVYVTATHADGTTEQVPLSAFATFSQTNTPLAVNHHGPFAAATISFNLSPGQSLGPATAAIHAALDRIGLPASVHGTFQGTARAFQDSLASEPLLVLAAILTIYIVLGILYESLVHPLTILTTLPSAGVGALLALLVFGTEFSVIALVGVILLIGIVKKNAIMMIDFAIAAQRSENLSAIDAIRQACRLRFRPIMMTTMAALFGAIPLALGSGDGAELRRPLGIAIVGGLVVSQLLTLYTTPVVYVGLDRWRQWLSQRSGWPMKFTWAVSGWWKNAHES